MEKRVTFSSTGIAIALILPQILLVFVFFYWPAGQALWWAFTLERPWGGGNEFVGFDNFRNILNDGAYWRSIWTSIVFMIGSTALAIVMGLMLALFVDRQLRGYNFYRAAFIWPYTVAAPAAGLAFRFLFAPEAGVFATVNQAFPGFWNPALDGADAMALIIFAYSWKYVAYNFIFFLAALQSIPRSVTEAAAMDGASPLRRMWDHQLPLIMPTIFFILVINITESFVDSFGIVDLTTEGGPAKSTDLMVYKIYFDGFKGLDYSGAAAQSIILMLLVMMLTVFQFRFIERKMHYS